MGVKMDKRWILILITIIIAACCGYFIVSSSDTVGNAIVDVNTFTLTVPPGFGIDSSTIDTTNLIKRDGIEKISIKDLGKHDIASKEFNKKLKSLSKNADIEVLDNATNTKGDYKLYTITYKSDSQKELLTQSVSYIYTYEHTFSIDMNGFSDKTQMNDVLSFIAKTLQPDYKKSQE